MSERFTSDLVFILIALIIAAVLGFIIGYLYRRIRKARFLALQDDNEQLKVRLDSAVKQLDSTVKQLDSTVELLDECKKQKEMAFDSAAAKRVFNMKIVENDLKIVEGIGEKIASILNKNGIVTWLQLSEASPEKIKEILLTDGGPSYKIHEPGTWPEQALLAHEGKWAKLKEYQDHLTAGRQN